MSSVTCFPAEKALIALTPQIIRNLAALLIPSNDRFFWWPIYRFFQQNFYPLSFLFIFLLRYIRVVNSLYGKYKNRPTPIPLSPTYHTTDDVTVIISTTDIIFQIPFHVLHNPATKTTNRPGRSRSHQQKRGKAVQSIGNGGRQIGQGLYILNSFQAWDNNAVDGSVQWDCVVTVDADEWDK
jgi:hypothetical protein